jgi:outer membrane protein OmpA-like peptidoglycan-associated protein
LIQKGLSKGNIIIKAHGEATPLIETPDGAKEKANRRVEIFINE